MISLRGLAAVVLYLIIIISVMQSYVLIGLVTTVFFTFRYGAVSLIPLAILLDGYYGSFYEFPVLSMVTIIWYLFSEILTARLSVVQSKHE
jgi:hypothetical protein